MTTLSVNSLPQSLGEVPPDNIIFGHSEAMQAVRSQLAKVAAANVPVLITGESGTGKDIIARLIHALSPWKVGPFVKVNCPAIPGTLLESELFGYEKGAFTGAFGAKPGRVEMAHRGTLFLDEISELDPSLQSKLLQLLQDGQFCRIGAQEDKKVEVRVVCATNRNLEAEIEAGTFRQDLYYRINVVNLRMPSLRERRGDIEDLCAYFLEYYNRKFNCRARAAFRRSAGGAAEISLAGKYSRTGKPDQALRDSGARGSHHQRPGVARAGLLQSRHFFRRTDLVEEADAPGGARTGAQGHSEGTAAASLEPEAGGSDVGYQLSRLALQDSRCRIAFEPRAALATGEKNANSANQ